MEEKNGKETEDTLRHTAYFSEEDSHENIDNMNIEKEHNQSLKSKLLLKLIK
jgi:hypothetical protein